MRVSTIAVCVAMVSATLGAVLLKRSCSNVLEGVPCDWERDENCCYNDANMAKCKCKSKKKRIAIGASNSAPLMDVLDLDLRIVVSGVEIRYRDKTD